MPEREDDHLTPATRLLEKRREMAEVEQALAAQKEVCCFIIVIKTKKHTRYLKYMYMYSFIFWKLRIDLILI